MPDAGFRVIMQDSFKAFLRDRFAFSHDLSQRIVMRGAQLKAGRPLSYPSMANL
jgi:hypothetical protein